MSSQPKSGQSRYLLRLPSDLTEALRRLAAQDRRSFNAHLVWVLEQYVRRSEDGGAGQKDGAGTN